MGSDLFINYHCPFRKGGDPNHVQRLLRLKRYLDLMQDGIIRSSSIRLLVRKGTRIREQVYSQADLQSSAASLADIYPTCENCPANLKKVFGFSQTIGCHVFINSPMDEFAERILYETLVENSKTERAAGEQSNLVRALVVSTPADGRKWRNLTSPGKQRDDGSSSVSIWGNRPLTLTLHQKSFTITVQALNELLFTFPTLPLRAIEDILSFFRSFFAVVGSYVSTPDGRLDQRRNEQFWRRSTTLNELNLYIQLLKHSLRLARTISSVQN